MNTLENYLPVMREANGRWYWPHSTSIGTLVAIALLVFAGAYAYHYPTMKAEEATQRLERFNTITTQTIQGTQAAVARLQTLVADQPEWLRNLTAEQVRNLDTHLALIKPLDKAQVLQQAQTEQERYDKAQQLIESSPFKGLTKKQVPLSIEGKAYLDALDVKRPSRFDYQRLSDGVTDALPMLQAGFKLQAEAENLTHRVDMQLNGEKAAPLGLAATTILQAPTTDQQGEQQSAEQVQTPGTSANTLTNALRQAERDAAQQQRQAQLDAENQQRQAAQEARQTELLVQRKQQQAQQAAEQQRRDTERQARAAVEANQRAAQTAERQAAAEQQQAQTAIDAKKRECTASFMARAKCTAQGYNPLTGMKN